MPDECLTFINQSRFFMGSPRKLHALALCAALTLLAAYFSPVANAKPSNSAEKVFRFNVSPNGYPPYLIIDGDHVSGIMWTVVQEVTQRLGYTVEAHKVPRKRVDQMIRDGIIDGTSRAREWTSKPDDFLFTDPVVHIEEVVFFPKESPHQFNVVEDLFSLTLVTHLGYQYPALRPHLESGKINRFDVARDQDLFVYVHRGEELDAAVADRLVGQWILLQQDRQDQFRISNGSLSDFGFRIMLRPGWEAFAADFNRELAAMRESGEIEAILSQYR